MPLFHRSQRSHLSHGCAARCLLLVLLSLATPSVVPQPPGPRRFLNRQSLGVGSPRLRLWGLPSPPRGEQATFCSSLLGCCFCGVWALSLPAVRFYLARNCAIIRTTSAVIERYRLSPSGTVDSNTVLHAVYTRAYSIGGDRATQSSLPATQRRAKQCFTLSM